MESEGPALAPPFPLEVFSAPAPGNSADRISEANTESKHQTGGQDIDTAIAAAVKT
jgi:hypothetical protein